MPPPNAFGWNNSTVTVSFSCIPGAAPIQTCPSPVQVSAEGSNHVVSGTAVDTANNTATASDTVNLDLTPPVVTINSPANNSSVATPYVVVTGTMTDALSGPGSVNCNGVPATLSGTNFSCTVQLSSVSNSITAMGSDLAGNTASATVTVGVSMVAPTSLTITPGPATIMMGQTQSFAAVDQSGTRRPDATWSVSDSSIASFVSGSPNTLLGDTAGQVTLTATIGTASAQTQVTVTATAPTVGTVLWTAPQVPGFTTYHVAQAVPTANGPDLYSLSRDSSNDVLIQALKSDGELLWQTTINGSQYTNCCAGIPDGYGGLVLVAQNVMFDLDGATSSQKWQYTAQGSYFFNNALAVGFDGTIWGIELACVDNAGTNTVVDCLDAIDGTTGTLKSQVQLPGSTYYDQSTCAESEATRGYYTPPIIAPDG